ILLRCDDAFKETSERSINHCLLWPTFSGCFASCDIPFKLYLQTAESDKVLLKDERRQTYGRGGGRTQSHEDEEKRRTRKIIIEEKNLLCSTYPADHSDVPDAGATADKYPGDCNQTKRFSTSSSLEEAKKSVCDQAFTTACCFIQSPWQCIVGDKELQTISNQQIAVITSNLTSQCLRGHLRQQTQQWLKHESSDPEVSEDGEQQLVVVRGTSPGPWCFGWLSMMGETLP
ncbi:hypothetical protein KUCAC02_013349, partial [Chaenocephalus aceratus]